MIKLSRLNQDVIVVNCDQIDYIESIPETRIIMLNKETHIVRESLDEVIEKAIEYHARIEAYYR